MNRIHVQRYTSDALPTLGHVLVAPAGTDRRFQCFSLEDRHRDGPKVAGDTRIPEGEYRLEWREAGRFAQRWQSRGFPGSLHLQDVPGFSTILIHAGNSKKDTEGCILLGMGARLDLRTIQVSRAAVTKVYNFVLRYKEPWRVVVQ